MSETSTISLIAVCDGFELRHCPDRSDCDWHFYELASSKRGARKRIHLGWSQQQQRLARNHDSNLLRERSPMIYDWVLKELRQRPASEIAEHAADVHGDIDDSTVSADITGDSRAKALDLAAEQNRWREAQQEALQRGAEAQRQRERDSNTNWHRARYASYLSQFGAFGWPPTF
jgi:hypothetical protein